MILKVAPDNAEIRAWLVDHGPVVAWRRFQESFPSKDPNSMLDFSPSLALAVSHLLEHDPQAPAEALDSIPFYSLCTGVVLPLMALPQEREIRLFGFATPSNTPEERRELVAKFISKAVGLSLTEKVGLLVGDPFHGRSPGVREDSLTNVLANLTFWPLRKVREAIPRAGDLAGLFAMSRTKQRSDPPLGARVVLQALHGLRELTLKERRAVVRDLFSQCGRLEAYVLSGLILNKLHLALSGRQDYLLEILARQYSASLDSVEMVATLRDVFQLCTMLETEGPESLAKVTLKPLSPLRPALAGATIPADLKFPAWFECKYDGVRLMVHKDHDGHGRPLLGAFTRQRNDWVELVPGLRPLVQALPCQSMILDGELHGTVLSESGVPRPGTVYEVHDFLRGNRSVAVNLRYVAFDLLYLNGTDLTRAPFRERRRQLEALLQWAVNMALPLPVQISQGNRVDNREQMNRLYEQYRRQGHEGGMVKIEDSPYPVAERTQHWMKRKPEETLDLVLTAAFWSDPATAGKRMFDAYSISVRDQGGLKQIGTVGSLDAETTIRLAQTVMANNLLTGRSVEHKGSQRTAVGVELSPYLVVSVKFEGVVRDELGEISLRSPRVAALRPGEMPLSEICSLDDLRGRLLKQGLS